jgi:endonuclease/exonuclease/phosphatase family metal-dependent hydrolase
MFIISLLTILSACSRNDQFWVTSLNMGNQLNVDSLNPLKVQISQSEGEALSKKNDILAFQNVPQEKLQYLKTLFPEFGIVGSMRDSLHNKEEYVPILFKSNRFTLLGKSNFGILEIEPSETINNTNGHQIVTCVKLQNNATGHIFFVFNTAFSNQCHNRHEHSARLLLKRIYEIAGSAPVILITSFESQDETATYKLLISNWDKFLSLENSLYITENSKTDEEDFYVNPFANNKLNHVFINGYFRVIKSKVHANSFNQQVLSDNKPISIKLRFLFSRRSQQGQQAAIPWENQ